MCVVGTILGFLILAFQNSNACEKRDGICCLNYFRKGNICQECPAGTYGVNCSGKCVSGYYGRFCLEPCNCPSHLCDRINGCPKNYTLLYTSTVPKTPKRCRNGITCGERCNCSDGSCDLDCFQGLHDSTQSTSTTTHVKMLPTDDIKWQKIFFTLMGFILVVLVAAGFLYYKSREKKRSQAGHFQETDSQADSVEHNDQTVSMVTVHTTPRTNTDLDTNIYADIRSSQMMESQSYFFTQKKQSVYQKGGRGNGFSLRNFDPSEMECYAMNRSLHRQFSHNNDDPYCLTNVWISEDHRSLDDFDSDSDVSLSSKHSEDASQKNGIQMKIQINVNSTMADIYHHILCLHICVCIFTTATCGFICGNRCCLNYYQHSNGSCLDCPLGTFGVNCSGLCEERFYGRLCKSKCNCSPEDCDKEYGCKKKEFADKQATLSLSDKTQERLPCAACDQPKDQDAHNTAKGIPEDTMVDNPVWENVSFALIGSVVTILAAVGLVLLFSRLRKPHDEDQHKNATVDESTSEDVQQSEQPVVNASHQGIQNEVNENVYADVRSSKMVNVHGEGFSSNPLHIYSKDDVTDAVLEKTNGKMNNPQDNKDATYKEKQTSKMNLRENVYGNLDETSQYSFLSLRRNVDASEMENYFIKQSISHDTSQKDEASYCIMNAFETDNQQNEDACKSDSDISLTSEPYSIAKRKYDEP
ncbi:uncharacterized protein LOC134262051 [Saccostrea cucullata]|uniref:uncharacterized protein LOC134262051 n=1 Tax=Saccostrea cuccullata TaxID=36930 RepID=UPI002ED24A8E